MGEGSQGAHRTRRQAVLRKVHQRHTRFYERFSHWSLAGDGNGHPIRWHREHWILAVVVAAMVLLSVVIMPGWAHAMKPPAVSQTRTVVPLSLPTLPPQAAKPLAPAWHTVQVQAGQTLSDIFQSQGLGFSDLQAALDASKDTRRLTDIRPGDSFAFLLGAHGTLQAMRFDGDASHRVTLHFANGAATRTVATRTLEHRQHMAHGVIHSSLFAAAAKAGMNEAMMVKLADVFKYDIDFIKDIRDGDSFTVIYDTVYRDGAYLHSGEILAAEFYNQGKRYTAYRYTLPNGNIGYYSEDGRPLQKALLRTPVKFSRISSRFSKKRLHPILGYTRAHEGVDYASPKGTPIHAASNGTITVHGWVHGYGRYIRIKMNSKYSTVYAHMSRYARGLHVGSHVRQGQVIGYVGMSGLATGPHLHYEVRIHGHPVNPLKVTMPKPKPLAPKLLAKFEQHTQPMLARLERIDANVRLARATPQTSAPTHAD